MAVLTIEGDDLATMALDHPAAAYLLTLPSASSRYVVACRLSKAARMLTGAPRASWQTAPWHRLAPLQVQGLITVMAGSYTPAYTNNVLSCIKGVVRMAADMSMMDRETLRLILQIKIVAGGPGQGVTGRYVTAPERAALMRAALEDPSDTGRRDAAILATAYPGGLRRAEIAGLSREDVAFDGDLVILTVRGKGRKLRKVPLDGGGAHVLRDWLVIRRSAPGPLFWGGRRGGHLVSGSGITPKAVGDILARLVARAGVKHLTPHDLRRSVASDALDQTDAITVARLLGHASTATTAKYDRRSARAVRAVAAGLAIAHERS